MHKESAKKDRGYAVLLDGDIKVTDRLRQALQGRRIVVADGAMRHAAGLGVEPDIWLGDFDSTPDDLLKRWCHVDRKGFPAAKAKSDGELALEYCIEAGADNVLMCGLGGGPRMDHALFNLSLLFGPLAHSAQVWGHDGLTEYHRIPSGDWQEFGVGAGTIVSVFGFTSIRGLDIEGAHWPLVGRDIPFGSTLALSNLADATIRLRLLDGMALLIVIHDHGPSDRQSF